MKYIISVLFILAIVISCTTSDKKSKPLSKPDDTKADEYVVNTDRDTTIETKNGALLKIPKGALQGGGSTVTLEIKEAYSIEQMIKMGLMTTSNGEPLASGGMIYINAKGGQEVKITQAIKVALPADHLDKNMQLFKGEKDADGNINWKDPKPLPENKQLSAVDKGQVLFQSKCASCHILGKQSTGPDLAQFMKRFPIRAEAEARTESDVPGNERYYDHGRYKPEEAPGHEHFYADPYYAYKCNLMQRFVTSGPRLRSLMESDTIKGEDLLGVYHYIQNESDKRNLPLPSHAYLKDCADSCAAYRQTVHDLRNKEDSAESRRRGLIKDNGSLTEEKHSPGPPAPGNTIPTPPPARNYDEAVSPENNDAVYYQFTIESFGWYNIDVLMKGVDGNEKSELRVRIIGQYREKLDIFLIIPGMNAFVKGGPTEQSEGEYAFGYKDGTLYIPQNTTAYIMAYKETSSSIAFAMKEFTTTTQQNFEIALEESTVEVFNKAVSNIGNGRIKIDVHDSKNADEIRKTDTGIKNINQQLRDAEKLKPKRCDCDCGLASDSTKIESAAPAILNK